MGFSPPPFPSVAFPMNPQDWRWHWDRSQDFALQLPAPHPSLDAHDAGRKMPRDHFPRRLLESR
jgi:hypothetical protein